MKKILPIILIIIVVGVGAFFTGMKYGQSRKSFAGLEFNGRQMGVLGANFENGKNVRGGATGGEILSKDDTSITLKLQDGGSKIILYSDATKITKSTDGILGDLKNGENIIVTGSTNSDGSVTAQTIQIRPEISIQNQ